MWSSQRVVAGLSSLPFALLLFASCGGSTTAGPDGGGTTTGTFQLAWEDNFDAFDATRWRSMTHCWDSNLAQFSTANTTFANGIASLR